MIFLVLLACGLVGLGLFLVGWSTGGWAAIRRILDTETRPIRELTEGPVEISGVVEVASNEAAIVPPSGRPAVVMHLLVTAYRNSGKSQIVVHKEEIERRVATVISDDAGTAALVDFENVEVVAPIVVDSRRGGTFKPSAIPWVPLVPGGADRIVLEERIIEAGEHVMLSGHARIHEATIERASSPGYRDGTPTTRTTFRIHGTPTSRILVGPGTERQMLFRAVWPFALLVGGAVLAAGYAAVLFVVAAS